MFTVKHMLDQKGHDVSTISPEAKVIDALKLMADKSIGALIVLYKDQVVGILSERDFFRNMGDGTFKAEPAQRARRAPARADSPSAPRR